ncbi:hypothetical protein BDZ94DRAFT_33794 [Collybia nuda]|uniref:Acyl-CoA desaturase n=1 Tax=Collybia nuda TaxID=64659 RepID=A0A9P6CRA3_9AGAR|nr:hypothetical protein BDZ94DRAFT_33794 [Collybia nuda]
MSSPSPPVLPPISAPQIWWTNSIFFIAVHLAALFGIYYWPPHIVAPANLVLSVVLWQLGNLGITIGYHRLYSHRAFRASFGVRLILTAMGSSAFQGSVKWWCLRHRLHHRFTDDPIHDPYSATRGLFYSHMGWIFFKPTYERLDLIERDDLLCDPVVKFQHKYYVPLALILGFLVPSTLGLLWGDPRGAFIWGGLVPRLAIWHCTFLVNSMAHWNGLQPYSDEDTSRGNLILALLTCGEGNHNFHAFPHDFRSGPSLTDWDPSKWIIIALHHFGLVTGLRRARKDDVIEATDYMHEKSRHGAPYSHDIGLWEGQVWTSQQLGEYTRAKPGRCIVLIDGYAVDVTKYLREHPGGAALLRKYSALKGDDPRAGALVDASWAFNGGLNNHSRAAKRRMVGFKVAQIVDK